MDILETPLLITREETSKLLTLLGKDNSTADLPLMVDLVRSLYRILAASHNSNNKEELPIMMSIEKLLMMHRYFSPQSFGEGGRAFQEKIANALVCIERMEVMPELDIAEGAEDRAYADFRKIEVDDANSS